MSILAFVLAAFAAQAASSPSSTDTAASVDRAKAYHHFSLGLQARFAGRVDDALEEYRRAQKLDPTSSAIQVETARLLRELGRFDDALAAARQAVALDAADPDAHLALAQLLQMQALGAEEGLRQAGVEYEEVVRTRPADGQALISLAGIYDQLQDHEGAARTWQRYLAVDPGNFEAYVQQGTHLLLAGKPDEAAAALKAALALRPENARAYQLLGDIYARAEQVEQAVLHFRKALEIEPRDVRVRLSLGEVLVGAGRPEEALAEARAVLQQDESNRFALDLEGRCLRDLARYDEADVVADRLLAQDPTSRQATFLKVTIAEARRDWAGAIALIKELLARPHSVDGEAAASDRVFLLHLGFAYQQLERHAEAAVAFARAKGIGEAPDASLLGFHAEALYLAKQKKEALAAVRSARERFPDDVDLTGLEATLRREA
jgi:tetratricopeptide (TPR) repeat protein